MNPKIHPMAYMEFRDLKAKESKRFNLKEEVAPGLLRDQLFAKMKSSQAHIFSGTPRQYRDEVAPAMASRNFARELETARLCGFVDFNRVFDAFRVSGSYSNSFIGDQYTVVLCNGHNARAAWLHAQSTDEIDGRAIFRDLATAEFTLSLPLGAAHWIIERARLHGAHRIRVILIDPKTNRAQTRRRIDAQLRSLLYSLPIIEGNESLEEDIQRKADNWLEANPDKAYLPFDATNQYRLVHRDESGNWKAIRAFGYETQYFANIAAWYLPGAPGLEVVNVWPEDVSEANLSIPEALQRIENVVYSDS